ncbi:hypothetical protein [Arthrobacter sp. D2-10]
MNTQGEKVAQRRGHNALVVGLAVLVLGLVLAMAGNGGGTTGFGVLVAVGGLVTLLVGAGIRRER